MTKNEIYQLINQHPIFQLATVEGNQPRVRHMLLYRASEQGIYFHSSSQKEVFEQIMDNNLVEMCFFDLSSHTQVRISGKAVVCTDEHIKREILLHPFHHYLSLLRKQNPKQFAEKLIIFRLIQPYADVWNIMNNYNELERVPRNKVELD